LEASNRFCFALQPGNIERIAKGLVVLMTHAAVGIVYSDGPYFFARLFKSHNDVCAIHAFGCLVKEIPNLVAER
jgi:hypothetical protein